ncbi:MAG: polyprenyl synthetase family protein [bacterium]|nr:polyprenyl synthetase family protein [bacterium]
MDIKSFKQKFDPVLKNTLDARVEEYKKMTRDKFLRDMVAYPRELLLAGGKRIRPYMAYLMYKSEGGKKEEELLEFLVGIEIFHMFCLVHDDIIDRAHERHGLLPMHKYIVSYLKDEKRQGDHGHVGGGLAMLTGDLLYNWANSIIECNRFFGEKELSRVRVLYTQMVAQVILGEMLDVDMTTRRQVEVKYINEKMLLKTAKYSFVSPMQIGVALAGGSESHQKFCEDFGGALGVAFQIQDDLFDIMQDPDVLGKSVFSDIKENVHTLFTWYIFENGTATQKRTLDSLMGSAVPVKDYDRVRKLFKDSGAIEYGTKEMNKLFKKAHKMLGESHVKGTERKDLSNLLDYIESRSF